MLFNRKNVIITGTNRGIGKEVLENFSREGANVIAHARTQSNEFESYINELTLKYGNKITPVYFDINDTENMKSTMKRVIATLDTVDILVNNAGIAHGGYFSMTSVQTIRNVFETNLFSAMELTQLVLRKMIRQKDGKIVNMSSIAGIYVRPGNSAYGVSKAAVKMWTEVLASEVGQFGIRVNAVAPGLTDTGMAAQMENKAGKEMLQNSAMNRLASPSEIADAVLYLSSDKSSFVNGHTLVVNGGRI